ncbi:Peptidase family S41 [Pedobacter insulae]|uniref:Peptidase family S41 n=2 Tax=Pedobacter insulae TaxID=414048 RepID=A0A1I2TLR8_9SPHI|nr:Peptidase family S41 [Pedobacter insulae]
MWPMLIALSPFFKDGQLGSFKSSGLNEIWKKSGNKIFIKDDPQNERVYNSAVTYKLKNASIKIAVLINKTTQSAGEATTIALKSVKNVSFFGLRTRGLATSNETIPMDNGDFLILTTAWMYDCHSRKYPQGIEPDYSACNYQELENSLLHWVR